MLRSEFAAKLEMTIGYLIIRGVTFIWYVFLCVFTFTIRFICI